MPNTGERRPLTAWRYLLNRPRRGDESDVKVRKTVLSSQLSNSEKFEFNIENSIPVKIL